jgi:hypothetical protein
MEAERSEPTEMTTDIEAAFEEVEENAPEAEVVEAVVEEPVSAGEGEDPAPEVEGSAEEPDTPAENPDEVKTEDEKAEDKGNVEAVDEPPAGLSPEAREEWKDTPPAMKKAIAKREADFAKGIIQYSNDAKRAQAMDKSMQPYQQLFAMNGNNPPELVGNLLQTAASLQSGNPNVVARTLANLVNQFGDVGLLDTVLSGQSVPRETSQPQQNVQAQINQALAQRDQQHQQREQNTQMQAVSGDISLFANNPANEFYKDVREDMADILDMAGRRGLDMDLPTAYDRACQLRPDIKTIIDGRNSSANVASASKAAISISGSPGGQSNVSNSNSTLEDDIRNAWGDAGDRL